MNKKITFGVFCGCISILFIIGIIIGGYFGYTKWYQPKQAKDYINNVEKDFEKMNSYIEKFEDDIDDNFPEDGEMGGNSEYDEVVEQTKDSLDLVEKIQKDLKLAQENLPSDQGYTNSISKDLKDFYDSFAKLIEKYSEIQEFSIEYLESLKILSEFSNLDESAFQIEDMESVTKSAEKMREMAGQVEESKKNLEKVEGNDDLKVLKNSSIKLLDDMKKYLLDMADHLDSAVEIYNTGTKEQFDKLDQDVQETINEFSENLNEFVEVNTEETQKIRSELLEKLDEIKNNKEDIEEKINDIKEKHNI